MKTLWSKVNVPEYKLPISQEIRTSFSKKDDFESFDKEDNPKFYSYTATGRSIVLDDVVLYEYILNEKVK